MGTECYQKNSTRKRNWKKDQSYKYHISKWLEYMYKPDGLCVSELALHYQLLWTIREEMRQVNNV